jgi:hypothetical protein
LTPASFLLFTDDCSRAGKQIERMALVGRLPCVFRRSVTDRFGIVTADFGSVTDHFGDVTDGLLVPA